MAPKKMKVENVEEENQEDVTDNVQTIPKPNISRIKNKILRNEMYKKLKVEKRKVIMERCQIWTINLLTADWVLLGLYHCTFTDKTDP